MESPIGRIIVACSIGVLCSIGIVTNAVLISFYIRRPVMRTSTNVYLVHKAVSDLISLLPFPLHLAEILGSGWIFGDWVCKVVASVETLCMLVNANITFAMAYDRYVAVAKPGNGLQRTVTTARNHVAVSWLYGLMLVIPAATASWTVVWLPKEPAPGWLTCGYNWPAGEMYHSIYFGSLLVLFYAGHYLVYISFVYVAWGRVKQSKDEFLTRHDTVQRCRAVASVLIINFLGYFVYWAQHAYTMITLGEDQIQVPHIPSGLLDPLSVASTSAVYIVASGNLFLYSLSMDQWKAVTMDAVHCRCGPVGGRGVVQPFHAESVAVIDVTAAVDDDPPHAINSNNVHRDSDNDSFVNLSHHSDEELEIQDVSI
ncbi:somatostatin receptor type 5-like [Asterias rubens]|uniref:somatostatin receptor type 5-like n=1 Tax=Asterias rubens TaxID=7604 RepID=UPI001455D2FF|nr:somatostatin receptor type 5-like [Asterias rubens]